MTTVPGRGVKGGVKQKWIKEHEALITGYLDMFGLEATMQQFNLTKPTVLRLQREGNRRALPQNEKEMLLRRINDLSGQVLASDKLVRSLQEDYNQFVPNVAESIKREFLEPLLRRVISLPPGYDAPEIPNPLKIEDIKVEKLTSHTD